VLSQIGRLTSFIVAAFMGLAWLSVPAHASTDLLIPPSTDPGGSYTTNANDFPAWRIIPTSTATLSAATAIFDTVDATGYRVVVYANAVDRPGSVVGELSQSSSGSTTVQFTGCIPMLAGTTYWVGFQGSATGVFLSNIQRNTGPQTSSWQWDTSALNQARIQNGVSTLFNASAFPRATLAGTVTADPVCASNSGASLASPAPILQQFGVPKVGTCESAQPADLDWSGVSSGGWGVSWAQWMNSGTGGPVCTRQLVFVSGRWIVN
jgi:hypothetical protein